METARMTNPIPMTHVNEMMGKSRRASAAEESAVDAYATRILKSASPPEACIDENLGPYVTSLLRDSDAGEDVTLIPEYDSLIELLEEHCSLSPESATSTLQTIATAVKTGVVQEQPLAAKKNVFATGSLSVSVDTTAYADTGLYAGSDNDALASEEFPSLSEAENDGESTGANNGRTPLKPDRLIPVDLLGALDDPSTPVEKEMPKEQESTPKVEKTPPPKDATPPLSASTTRSKKSGPPKSKKKSKKEAEDLAAVLFRPSRPRQNSIDEDAAHASAPLHGPATPSQHTFETNQFFQQQWDAAVEMLLSMNPDLSEDAATEAAYVSNADVNVAQYIVDRAVSAPPVCRHMLNDGCYRSDCQFSHDVVGHTCLFWLRGRCGKGESCRFLHGFSEKMMEGIHQELPHEVHYDYNTGGSTLSPGVTSAPVAITTTNLVSHNMQTAFSAPQHDTSPFSSFRSSSASSALPSQGPAEDFLSSSWGEPSALESAMKSFHLNENQDRRQSDEGFSFASIASKGYSGASFSSPLDSTPARQQSLGSSDTPTPQQQKKTVRIPQDLWNPSINRNSQAFHIADPMERYAQVATSVKRDDVIDLHYQSTKTFSVVLANVLPEKLQQCEQVWIVTGSGHSVSRSTHQKGGGALERAVMSWLTAEGYDVCRGRDRNGHGGALLVKSI